MAAQLEPELDLAVKREEHLLQVAGQDEAARSDVLSAPRAVQSVAALVQEEVDAGDPPRVGLRVSRSPGPQVSRKGPAADEEPCEPDRWAPAGTGSTLAGRLRRRAQAEDAYAVSQGLDPAIDI